MKKKIKLLTLLLAAILMTGLVACGNDKEDTKKENASYGEIDTNATVNEDVEKESEEGSSNKEENEVVSNVTDIKGAKETDLVIYIDGKEVKFDQTWNEFNKMVEDYGWSLSDDPSNNWPNCDKEEYLGSGYVTTPIGEVEFAFMANENKTDSVIKAIYFFTNRIVKNNLNVCGIDPTTSNDLIKEKLELIKEDEYGCEYKVDNWVTVYVAHPYKGESNVYIERTQFHMRNK